MSGWGCEGKGREIWIWWVEGWVGSEPQKERVMLIEGGAGEGGVGVR